MDALAIVIPAYKPDFFRVALESLAAQTDTRFRVYVGDDAGPPEIRRITEEVAAAGLDVVYRRFDQNLGRRSLAGHWNRCVALSTEPWVWLFSDDDVMEPGCVAAVHEAIARGEVPDVLRFDTEVIDGRGRTLAVNEPHPPSEVGADFVHARLRGERHSYVVEYVFRRAAFDRAGGFPDYPVAWCADDVAWYEFSRGGEIRTLPGAKVRWRASGLNITDAKRKNQREKLEAGSRFLRFVREEVQPADVSGRRSAEDWRRARERWWIGQVRYLMPVGPSLFSAVLRSSDGVWERNGAGRLAMLAAWNASAAVRWMRGSVQRLVEKTGSR